MNQVRTKSPAQRLAYDEDKKRHYGNHHAPVTKSDSTRFEPSAIYVGGAGVVVALDTDGNSASYTAIAGSTLPVLCTAVMSTDTTATAMVRFW